MRGREKVTENRSYKNSKGNLMWAVIPPAGPLTRFKRDAFAKTSRYFNQ